MGYSQSKRALQRVKKYLDELQEKNEKLTWAADNPAKLAHMIREGISVARQFALDENKQPVEPYAGYASLSAKYIIRAGNSIVTAEPRELSPILAAREAANKMVLPDLVSSLEIVGAVIKHKAVEMYFPDGDPEPENVTRVYAWSSKNNYHLIISEEGITVTKNDPGELAWKP